MEIDTSYLRSIRIHDRALLVCQHNIRKIMPVLKTAMLDRFAWTAFTPSIYWMSPTAAGVMIGFGVLCIFLPCFNYLVDAFLPM